MEIFFGIFIFFFGACLGSFLCCQARRLRLKEKSEKKPFGTRSVCLSCGYKLKWYDNLPIISWLLLGGKCRKCHEKIGIAELISEIGTGVAFLLISLTFNRSICSISPTIFGTFPKNINSPFCPAGGLNFFIFALTLIFLLLIIFLAIYDGLYGELPSLLLTFSIICAIIIYSARILSSSTPFSLEMVLNPLLSVLILGGLYLLLYLISKGKWVGDGDWLLGTALALVLASPWLALLTLFLSNLLALLVMLPTLKKTKSRKIYFGPFLVIAFIIIISSSDLLLSLIN